MNKQHDSVARIQEVASRVTNYRNYVPCIIIMSLSMERDVININVCKGKGREATR